MNSRKVSVRLGSNLRTLANTAMAAGQRRKIGKRSKNGRQKIATWVAAGVAAAGLVGQAYATTYTWTGGGGGNVSWSDTSNWGGTAPTSATTTNIDFGGNTTLGNLSTPLNQNIANGFIFGNLTFDSTAGAFFLGGSDSFDDSSGSIITQSSANAQNIANAFSSSNNSSALTLSGNGTGIVTLSGAITGKSGSHKTTVTKSGTSEYSLTSNSDTSGSIAVTISAGILQIAGVDSVDDGGSCVTISSGGILDLNGNFDANPIINASSTGIVALNGNNSSLSGLGSSSAFLGAFGNDMLTSTAYAGGASTTYRLGGGGGTLTIGTANLITGSDSVLIGSSQTNGSGTVIFAGNQSYTGNTTVAAGTLQINGANSSTAAYLVGGNSTASAPTLAGTGTIKGALTVFAAGNGSVGHLAPGAGTVGSLTATSTVIFGNQTILDYYFGAAGGNHASPASSSRLVMTATGNNSLSLPSGGYLTLNNLGSTISGTGSFELFSYGNATTPASFVSGFAGNTTATGANANLGSIHLGSGFAASETYSLVNDPTDKGLFLDYGTIANPIYNLSAAASNTTIIVGGSSTITNTITNTLVTNGDTISYTTLQSSTGAGGNVTGTAGSGGPLAGNSSGTGTQSFASSTQGTYTITPSASVTTGNSTTATLGTLGNATITVLNHASGTLTHGNLSAANAFVGASVTVPLTLSNAANSANLVVASVNGNITSGISGGNVSAGGNATGTGTLLTSSTGNVSTTFAVVYGDQQNLSGASSTAAFSGNTTASVNVFNHAAGGISGSTLSFPTVIVGYTGNVTSNALTVTNTAANPAGTLNTTGSSALGNVTLNNVLNISAGNGTGSLTATLGSGHNAGTFSGNTTVTYADGSAYAGANSNLGNTTVTISGDVENHASASLSNSSDNLGTVITGASLSHAFTLNNAAGNNAGLQVTGANASNGTLSGNTSGVIAAGGNKSFSFSGTAGAAGNYTGTETFNLSDDQTVLGWGNLSSQTYTLTANVVNHANGVLNLTSDAAVNARPSATVTPTLTFTNSGSNNNNLIIDSSVNLSGIGGTLSSSGNITPTATGMTAASSGGGTITGNYSVTWHEDNSAIGATAGSQTSTQNVTVTTYDYANPTLGSVNFGIVHVGDGAGSVTQQLSVTNTTISNASYQDNLSGNFAGSGTSNGAVSVGGNFSGLAAGSVANTALTYTASTATAGSLAGNNTVTLTSVPTASGLSNKDLSTTVNFIGQVNNYANPAIAQAVGTQPGSLSRSGSNPINSYATSYTLDFGTITATVGNLTDNLNLSNTWLSAFQDNLGGNFTITSGCGNFSLTGLNEFHGLAADNVSTNALAVGLNEATAGNYSETFTFTPLSENASGNTSLGSIAVTLNATIQPGTLIWNGNNSGNWDTSTNNWQGSATYADPNSVVFDDTAAGPNYTVDLGGATFNPGNVTVNNSANAYTIGNGTIGGNTSLVKNGTNTLTLTGSNTFSGGTVVNAGTLEVATASSGLLAGSTVTNNATMQFDGSQTLGTLSDSSGNGTSGTTIVSGTGSLAVTNTFAQANLVNNGAMEFSGTAIVTTAITGTGTTTVDATGNLTTAGLAQTALVNNGIVQITGTGTIGQLTGSGNLTIGNGSSNNTVQLVQNATLNSFPHTQQAVTISSGSTLDITNNTLMLNYGNGSSPLAAVQAAVADGAIMSSTANAGRPGQFAVGYADSTEIAGIPSGNVEVMYTLAGDARLIGSVNFTDYSILQNNYNQSGRDWSQGDWNNDGVVNFSDYSMLQNNYGQSIDGLLTDSSIVSQGITAAVPEPATMSLLLLGGLPMLARRRRK